MTQRKITAPTTPIAQQLALLQAKRRSAPSPDQSSKRRPPHSWVGFRGKTLWDWLSIILIPIILAVYTLITTVNMAEQQTKIADEQLKSQVLRDYTSTIQTLMLDKNLRQSEPEDDIRTIATTQTSLALEQLDRRRKAHLLLFIYRSQLISSPKSVILLSHADLSEVSLQKAYLSKSDLREAHLSRADLVGASLSEADLSYADLSLADLTGANLSYANLYRTYLSEAYLSGINFRETDLREASLDGAYLYRTYLREANLAGAYLTKADLTEANLTEANLAGANLAGANLTGAKVTNEQLKQAASLRGTTLPDGSRHP